MLTYLHGDHLGSASLATTAQGGVISEMRYYPYGETRSGDLATDRRYTGQRWEDGIGLYDYNARYYAPTLGRFISADTIVPSPSDPQSLNRYSYVRNNPLKYTDPSGHALWAGEDIALEFDRYRAPMGRWSAREQNAIADQAFATVVDFAPGAGDAKGFVEVFTGEDLITGEGLGAWRWLGLVALSEVRHLRHVDEVAEVVQKRVVIGEGMEAVIKAARHHDARWYQAWGKYFEPENFDLAESLMRNERWIRQKIRDGYEILDIGLDPARTTRRSPFYALEKRILKEMDYPTILIPRP